MSNPPLTQSQIEGTLSNENLDELLHLWWTEQGAAKKRDLELMSTALPFSPEQGLRVLDLCCGPGDAGRTIRSRFPNSRIDCVDRDLFLISICMSVNRREGVPGQTFVRDMWNTDWYSGLSRDYSVVATANALHWFDARRVRELFTDVLRLLRSGGVFLVVEAACAEKTVATRVCAWKA